MKPGLSYLNKITATIETIPYSMPEFIIKYHFLQANTPVEEQFELSFPIFYQSFFTFAAFQSIDKFRASWDVKKYTCHERLVTSIFIGKFDFVKDELHLQRVFPGIILTEFHQHLSRADESRQMDNYLVPFHQYGMILKNGSDEIYWMQLNIDMTNTMFIECLVETASLREKAKFLLKHIRFVISE